TCEIKSCCCLFNCCKYSCDFFSDNILSSLILSSCSSCSTLLCLDFNSLKRVIFSSLFWILLSIRINKFCSSLSFSCFSCLLDRSVFTSSINFLPARSFFLQNDSDGYFGISCY